jgi:hypothetical protein
VAVVVVVVAVVVVVVSACVVRVCVCVCVCVWIGGCAHSHCTTPYLPPVGQSSFTHFSLSILQ